MSPPAKHAKAVAVFVVLLVVVLAVLRAWLSRELILQNDGRPIALMRGSILVSAGRESSLVPTSTDADGRLDLSAVPLGADYMNIEWQDNAGTICGPNTLIEIPRGSCRKVVDLHGGHPSSPTTRTYADFVMFKAS